MTATEIVRFVSGLAYEGRLLFASCVNGVVIQDVSIAAAASAFLALPYDVRMGVAKTIAQDYGVVTIGIPAPLTAINDELEIVEAVEEKEPEPSTISTTINDKLEIVNVADEAPKPKKKAKAKAKPKAVSAKKPVAKKK